MNALEYTYYEALLAKDAHFDGVFFVGVKTTGVFCRPTCPARKPKFMNCTFFKVAKDALLAGFRPCKRCEPLLSPGSASKIIQILISAVEENPEHRWKDSDFKHLSIDIDTARRHFKKRFGMTFVAYARARRMGIAMKHIQDGSTVIDAQLDAGFESGSGFRDAFSRIMGTAPVAAKHACVLKAAWLDTKLGPMLIIADEKALHLLEFVDRRGLEREIERLRTKLKAAIIPGTTAPILFIEKELKAYFDGELWKFQTPIILSGSPFQKRVWEELMRIPAGETCSYADIAQRIGQPTAFRAVANANGANQLALIVPCHRVIKSNGDLCGYGGGVPKKKWLLEHEKKALENGK